MVYFFLHHTWRYILSSYPTFNDVKIDQWWEREKQVLTGVDLAFMAKTWVFCWASKISQNTNVMQDHSVTVMEREKTTRTPSSYVSTYNKKSIVQTTKLPPLWAHRSDCCFFTSYSFIFTLFLLPFIWELFKIPNNRITLFLTASN